MDVYVYIMLMVMMTLGNNDNKNSNNLNIDRSTSLHHVVPQFRNTISELGIIKITCKSYSLPIHHHAHLGVQVGPDYLMRKLENADSTHKLFDVGSYKASLSTISIL